MRVASWLLVLAGLATASIGIEDAGVAWWSQRVAAAAAIPSPEPLLFPPGFAGRLLVPRLHASLYIVDAQAPKDLRRGPGYIPGSSAPGGKDCIIAGHRDLHFRLLKDLKLGDEIDIQSSQGSFIYHVASFEIVSPTDNEALRATYPGQLTLVTCYPFYYIGPAPERFVVKAALR